MVIFFAEPAGPGTRYDFLFGNRPAGRAAAGLQCCISPFARAQPGPAQPSPAGQAARRTRYDFLFAARLGRNALRFFFVGAAGMEREVIFF